MKVADIERRLGVAKRTIGSLNRKITRLTDEKKRKLDLIDSNVEEFYKKIKETVNEESVPADEEGFFFIVVEMNYKKRGERGGGTRREGREKKEK